MHKVKTQCHGASCLPKHVYFLIFYMVIIKNYKVKKLFNKFPEISGKIGINFRKFPNSQPYLLISVVMSYLDSLVTLPTAAM